MVLTAAHVERSPAGSDQWGMDWRASNSSPPNHELSSRGPATVDSQVWSVGTVTAVPLKHEYSSWPISCSCTGAVVHFM